MLASSLTGDDRRIRRKFDSANGLARSVTREVFRNTDESVKMNGRLRRGDAGGL